MRMTSVCVCRGLGLGIARGYKVAIEAEAVSHVGDGGRREEFGLRRGEEVGAFGLGDFEPTEECAV